MIFPGYAGELFEALGGDVNNSVQVSNLQTVRRTVLQDSYRSNPDSSTMAGYMQWTAFWKFGYIDKFVPGNHNVDSRFRTPSRGEVYILMMKIAASCACGYAKVGIPTLVDGKGLDD